jgi:GTP cyclohydrolase I
MKQTVTPLTLLEKDFEHIEEIGDNHASLNLETPLREDAFEMSDVDKIKKIAHHFSEIMQTMGLDLSDDSLSGTPLRVAKMYVKEVFSGLDPKNKPTVKLFENKYGYKEMLGGARYYGSQLLRTSFCTHNWKSTYRIFE